MILKSYNRFIKIPTNPSRGWARSIPNKLLSYRYRMIYFDKYFSETREGELIVSEFWYPKDYKQIHEREKEIIQKVLELYNVYGVYRNEFPGLSLEPIKGITLIGYEPDVSNCKHLLHYIISGLRMTRVNMIKEFRWIKKYGRKRVRNNHIYLKGNVKTPDARKKAIKYQERMLLLSSETLDILLKNKEEQSGINTGIILTRLSVWVHNLNIVKYNKRSKKLKSAMSRTWSQNKLVRNQFIKQWGTEL